MGCGGTDHDVNSYLAADRRQLTLKCNFQDHQNLLANRLLAH